MLVSYRDDSDITHHFADGFLGLVQLLPGAVDQALGVSHSVACAVGLSAGVVHRAADVLQSVPLSGQSVVDAVETIQQPAVHVCRVKGRDGEIICTACFSCVCVCVCVCFILYLMCNSYSTEHLMKSD